MEDLRRESDYWHDGEGQCAIASVQLYNNLLSTYPNLEMKFCISNITLPLGQHCYLEVYLDHDWYVLDITAEQFAALDTDLIFSLLNQCNPRYYNATIRFNTIIELQTFLRKQAWPVEEIP